MSKHTPLTETQQKLKEVIFNYPTVKEAQIYTKMIEDVLNNPNKTRAEKKKARLEYNANYSSMNPSAMVLMGHPSSGHRGIETLMKPDTKQPTT